MVDFVVREPADVKEAVETAILLPPGGEEAFLKFGKFKTSFKTRRGFLADSLMNFKKQGKINFTKHHDSIFSCVTGGFVLLLVKSQTGSGRYGESIYAYSLTVEKADEIVISESDDDHDYNDHSRRRPIMELYDLVSKGQLRKIPISHVCGLMGYNPMLGDTCEACEEERKNRG